MVIDLSIAKDCRDSSPQIYAQALPDLYQGGCCHGVNGDYVFKPLKVCCVDRQSACGLVGE